MNLVLFTVAKEKGVGRLKACHAKLYAPPARPGNATPSCMPQDGRTGSGSHGWTPGSGRTEPGGNGEPKDGRAGSGSHAFDMDARHPQSRTIDPPVLRCIRDFSMGW